MKELIGKRIRKIRESKDLSQENMAEDLKMTTSAYSKIERGVTDPSATKLLKIAEILKVDVRDFFADVKQKFARAEEDKSDYGFATKRDVEELSLVIQELAKQLKEIKKAEKPAKQTVSKKR